MIHQSKSPICKVKHLCQLVSQLSYISSTLLYHPSFSLSHCSTPSLYSLFSSSILDSFSLLASGQGLAVPLPLWLLCLFHWFLCFLLHYYVTFYMGGSLLFSFLFILYSLSFIELTIIHSFITLIWIITQLCIESILFSMFPFLCFNMDISLVPETPVAWYDCDNQFSSFPQIPDRTIFFLKINPPLSYSYTNLWLYSSSCSLHF